MVNLTVVLHVMGNGAMNLRIDEKFLIAEQAERDVLKHFFNSTG